MFVFGLPRTGTTLTINLLSADPARRCLLRWESLNSAPPAAAGALHSDPRCIAEQARLATAVKYAPQIAAAHYEDADSPSECQFAMAPSFCAQLFDSNLHIPTYHDWFLYRASYLPAFRFHKQLLQLLQAENGGRWTLKNPWHPLFSADLTTVYPDAQLVMTHRDPAEVVGSACSLIRLVRPMFSDVVDLRQIADQMIETFDLMIERQNAYRDQHGEKSIYDIQYVEQLRDPVGQIRKLYAHFDEPLTAEAELGDEQAARRQPAGQAWQAHLFARRVWPHRRRGSPAFPGLLRAFQHSPQWLGATMRARRPQPLGITKRRMTGTSPMAVPSSSTKVGTTRRGLTAQKCELIN